jgi:uncharacterized membrane protein YhaH (DUF805 family)
MNVVRMLFGFEGRIRRLHYWLWGIGSAFVDACILTVLLSLGGGYGMWPQARAAHQDSPAGVWLIACGIVLLLALWTQLALQVKRWHDRDKSGLWVFISFIPLIGSLWILVECGFLDGTPGPNRFGPSPKGLTGPGTIPA